MSSTSLSCGRGCAFHRPRESSMVSVRRKSGRDPWDGIPEENPSLVSKQHNAAETQSKRISPRRPQGSRRADGEEIGVDLKRKCAHYPRKQECIYLWSPCALAPKIPDRTPHLSRAARHPLPKKEGRVPRFFTSLSLGERVPNVGGRLRGHIYASGCRDAAGVIALKLYLRGARRSWLLYGERGASQCPQW
jgi:hypothetical protein